MTTAEHISEVWVLCGVWREGLGGEVLTVANDAVRWPAQVGGPPPPCLGDFFTIPHRAWCWAGAQLDTTLLVLIVSNITNLCARIVNCNSVIISVILQQNLTFFLSRMEPFPLTITLQPVSCSSCLAVSPRGPRMRPTKLNWKYRKMLIK